MTALDLDDEGSGREVCMAWRSKFVTGEFRTELLSPIQPLFEARHSAFLSKSKAILTPESTTYFGRVNN